jgi:hypothetical protein
MKKIFLVLFLALLAAGAAFAQKTGDIWRVGNEAWVVQAVSGDTMTMKKAGALDGVWEKTDGFGPPIVTISGANAVLTTLSFAETNPNIRNSWSPRYTEAADKGMIKIGDTFVRNIQSAGADARGRTTTWNCESLYITGSGRNAKMEWRRDVITADANGQILLPGWGLYRKR